VLVSTVASISKNKLIKIEDILIRGKLKINVLLPIKSLNPNP